MGCVDVNYFFVNDGEDLHQRIGYAASALVLALGMTGWMQTLDAFWGEAWLQELHEIIASTLDCAGFCARHSGADHGGQVTAQGALKGVCARL